MKKLSLHIHLPEKQSWLSRIIWFFRSKTRRMILPESWMELNDEQRKEIFSLHLLRGTMTEEAFRLELLRRLLGIPVWLLYAMRPLEIVQKLLPYIDWALNVRIEKPFQPVIDVAGKKWRIPAPMVADMTLQQYLQCEERFVKMLSSAVPDPSPFLAAFLRPDTPETEASLEKTGLLPQASAYHLATYAAALVRAGEVDVFYLVQYYLGTRELLRQKYPHLFPEPKPGPKPPPEKVDWESIAPRIAELGVFGSLEEVLRTPATAYLAWNNARLKTEEKPKTLQDIIREKHNNFVNRN